MTAVLKRLQQRSQKKTSLVAVHQNCLPHQLTLHESSVDKWDSQTFPQEVLQFSLPLGLLFLTSCSKLGYQLADANDPDTFSHSKVLKCHGLSLT